MPLYNKHNYLNKNINFIINRNIYEYDIKDAGFNIIKQEKLLPKKLIQKLDKLEKKQRHIVIGKIFNKYDRLNKNLMKYFIEYRKLFFESNGLYDEEILTIKKDSIFIIDKKTHTNKFGLINFRLKNKYTSYYNLLDNKEFYFNQETLDIKGLSKEILLDQENYWISFLKDIFKQAECKNNNLMKNVIEFRNMYLDKKLKLNFYKEIDNLEYSYKTNFKFTNYEIHLNNIDNNLIHNIDISYNYINILMKIISYYVNYGFI